MKALTLHQPWATFIADGRKRFETRDWPPPGALIGQRIAIHAGKKVDWQEAIDFKVITPEHPDIDRGVVVCTAILAGVYQVTKWSEGPGEVFWNYERGYGESLMPGPGGAAKRVPRDSFGNYAVGRWIWWLTHVDVLTPPIPAKGRQKLWEWTR